MTATPREIRNIYFELIQNKELFGSKLFNFKNMFEIVWPIVRPVGTSEQQAELEKIDINKILQEVEPRQEKIDAIFNYIHFIGNSFFITSREKIKLLEDAKNEFIPPIQKQSEKFIKDYTPAFEAFKSILLTIDEQINNDSITRNTFPTAGKTELYIKSEIIDYLELYLNNFVTLEGCYSSDGFIEQFNSVLNSLAVKYDSGKTNVSDRIFTRAKVNYTGLSEGSLGLHSDFYNKTREEARNKSVEHEELVAQLIEEARHQIETEDIANQSQFAEAKIKYEETLKKLNPSNSKGWFDKVKEYITN